jgi:phosphotransferase system enzyme I (PtsI)
MAPRTVTLRTFDIGGDKFSTAFRLPREMNPALGLRAVRLALREREVFRAQLRAMLRAACARRRARDGPDDLDGERAARVAPSSCLAQESSPRGARWADVPFGIMVETPERRAHGRPARPRGAFFSIGTNDLMQYTLAIDRGNEHVAHLARSLDPAILRSISPSPHAAEGPGIPCGMCGAMAGELLALPMLVGVGVHELSVEPTAVPEIKEALSRIDLAGGGRRGGRSLANLLADLGEGLLLELTDALARQVVLVADLLERELLLVVEAEAPADDARLHGAQGVEQPLDLVGPRARRDVLEGRHGFSSWRQSMKRRRPRR